MKAEHLVRTLPGRGELGGTREARSRRHQRRQTSAQASRSRLLAPGPEPMQPSTSSRSSFRSARLTAPPSEHKGQSVRMSICLLLKNLIGLVAVPQCKGQWIRLVYRRLQSSTIFLCPSAIRSTDKGDADTAAKINSLEKKTISPTRQELEACKTLLRFLGVPVVQAASEGEAQCIGLCKEAKAKAVASEDFDCLPLGAPLLLRDFNLNKTKLVKKF
ncbi:flap endonuclease 1-like [Panicum virgatum]|uniref:flap endonuclease 1-like n=1 Tax=Panicum virgatum TaxID=38727 RepID=UPI0019D62DA7|nr:flap endonuclease 1-like [Panicum virgatum]